MTRQTQLAQKTQRAVHDLESYGRQLERLARRVSRIVLKDEPDDEDADVVASIDPAVKRLEMAVAKLKDAAPAMPRDDGPTLEALMGDQEPDHDFAEILTELGVDPADELFPVPELQPGECVLRGLSPSLTVPTVLEFLALQRKTGLMHVKTPDENFHIEIVDGLIVYAASDASPLEERLGNILMRRGVIGAEQLQRLLDEESAGLLGATLERENLVSKENLLEALEHQASLLFRRLFSHRQSEFSFYEAQPSDISIRIQASVTRLLLEGARTSDEFENQPKTDWEAWMK